MGIFAKGHSKFREDIASIKTNTKQIWHCIDVFETVLCIYI